MFRRMKTGSHLLSHQKSSEKTIFFIKMNLGLCVLVVWIHVQLLSRVCLFATPQTIAH